MNHDALIAKMRVLKSIYANLEKSAEKAREAILCAYVNINNLVDYTGWDESSGDGGETILTAAASCVKLDPNHKQLPAQRLGN